MKLAVSEDKLQWIRYGNWSCQLRYCVAIMYSGTSHRQYWRIDDAARRTVVKYKLGPSIENLL